MPWILCWLVLGGLSLGLVVQRLALPWWADFCIGLAGGIAVVWLAGLVLCHRAGVVQVVLYEKPGEDEARELPPKGTPPRCS